MAIKYDYFMIFLIMQDLIDIAIMIVRVHHTYFSQYAYFSQFKA